MSSRIPAGGGVDELEREPGSSGQAHDQRPGENDLLNLAYGGDAVRDGQHRAAIHDAVEGLLDEALALRVERNRRLAQRKDEAAAAPTRDPGLRSSAVRPHPALADLCAAALRQTLDRLHRRRRPGRRPADFRCRRPGTAMADIVDNISGSEPGLMGHDPEQRPELGRTRALKADSP